MKNSIIEKALKELAKMDTRSAWNRGVNEYAAELLEEIAESIQYGHCDPEDLQAPKLVRKHLLNGADNWQEYSWGGSALIYDSDIAERLCTPSELRKTRNGERRPNAREQWLDTQARALYQAGRRAEQAIRKALEQ